MWPQPAANWLLNTKLPLIYCPGICSTRKNNFVGRSTELKEGFVAVTRDLEFWRDGGRKGRTLVGSSFSMECLLCGAMRLSGWGVEDMGRNCGGAGKRRKWRQKLRWRNWRVNDRFLLDCEYKVLDISRRVLLFLATTDSGDVSSTSEADTLELLSDFRVFCSSYSRKKRRLTIVFCLSEYFGRVFANIEDIKPTHIWVGAIKLGQRRCFEQPLSLGQRLASGYTVYGAPSWRCAIGQGQCADSQLSGSIRDVCVWVDNRDIIRHQSGQQRKLWFVYTAPNYELFYKSTVYRSWLLAVCIVKLKLLKLDLLVSILLATVMT